MKEEWGKLNLLTSWDAMETLMNKLKAIRKCLKWWEWLEKLSLKEEYGDLEKKLDPLYDDMVRGGI